MTDYQDFTTKDMPIGERRKLNVGNIWSNSIKCTKCGDVIRSKNRHDFVRCECGAVFVDGGSWYQRIGGAKGAEDLTELYDDI